MIERSRVRVLQERFENFLLQVQLSLLTLISVSLLPNDSVCCLKSETIMTTSVLKQEQNKIKKTIYYGKTERTNFRSMHLFLSYKTALKAK